MPNLDTDIRLEKAFREIFLDALIDADINISFQPHSDKITLPALAIKCLGGSEDSIESGNERLNILITLRSSAMLDATDLPDPVGSHQSVWGSILDVLWDDDLSGLLTASAHNITVFNSITRSRGPNNVIEQSFISEVSLNLSVSATSIA